MVSWYYIKSLLYAFACICVYLDFAMVVSPSPGLYLTLCKVSRVKRGYRVFIFIVLHPRCYIRAIFRGDYCPIVYIFKVVKKRVKIKLYGVFGYCSVTVL